MVGRLAAALYRIAVRDMEEFTRSYRIHHRLLSDPARCPKRLACAGGQGVGRPSVSIPILRRTSSDGTLPRSDASAGGVSGDIKSPEGR